MLRPQLSILRTLAMAGVLVATGCSDLDTSSKVGPTGVVLGPSDLAVSGGPEYADVMNQVAGGGGVYAANGARLVRQAHGLRASVTVPTPQPGPGTYVYPAGTVPGHPEVFTLWVFVFNYPSLCSAPCDGNDLGLTAAARGGVYNGGGHVASGAWMTIAGRIGVGETSFGGAPLESPTTAEVHLAIAPHGFVAPADRPTEFRIPRGGPPSLGLWWVAMFIP